MDWQEVNVKTNTKPAYFLSLTVCSCVTISSVSREICIRIFCCSVFLWRYRYLLQLPLGASNEIYVLVICKLILMIGGWCVSCEIALTRMSFDLTNDKSALVQVMAWCRQATSQYLSRCWARSMPQIWRLYDKWVKWSTSTVRLIFTYIH